MFVHEFLKWFYLICFKYFTEVKEVGWQIMTYIGYIFCLVRKMNNTKNTNTYIQRITLILVNIFALGCVNQLLLVSK